MKNSRDKVTPEATPAEKIHLITEWDRWFKTRWYEHYVHGPLRSQMAHLWATIARGERRRFHCSEVIIKCLKQDKVPSTDRIWDFIEVVTRWR